MLTRSDLEATLVAELLRVVGQDQGNNFHSLVPEGTDGQLATAVAQLRELPTGIGYREMMRRLQQQPD